MLVRVSFFYSCQAERSELYVKYGIKFLLITKDSNAGKHVFFLFSVEVWMPNMSCCCGPSGVTNDFLISTMDPLALRYTDTAPLENHHCAAAFAVLKKPGCNFMSLMPKACPVCLACCLWISQDRSCTSNGCFHVCWVFSQFHISARLNSQKKMY